MQGVASVVAASTRKPPGAVSGEEKQAHVPGTVLEPPGLVAPVVMQHRPAVHLQTRGQQVKLERIRILRDQFLKSRGAFRRSIDLVGLPSPARHSAKHTVNRTCKQANIRTNNLNPPFNRALTQNDAIKP